MADYRTPTQIRKAERNVKICAEYRKRREADSDVSRARIISYIAEKNGIEAQTVRGILIENNVY